MQDKVVELRGLLAKAEQEADDVRYYSGTPAGMRPHALAFAKAAQTALPALLSHIERLEAALRGLEDANEALCATRSQVTYLFMLDHDQSQPELEALDDARRVARLALNQEQEQGCPRSIIESGHDREGPME